MLRLFIFFISLFFYADSFTQSTLSYLENKIESMLITDSKTWKASTFISGTVNVNDINRQNDKIILEGNFIAKVTQWPFNGKRTIKFKAEINQVFDDFLVKKIWWTQPITGIAWCVGKCP